MIEGREKIAVVLAEDDPDDRFLTIRALEKNRFVSRIQTVEDGEELLDYLLGRNVYEGRNGLPGVILLDLNMPRKDGREVLREIKSDPMLRRIPVVVLTTSSAEDDINQAYDLGVNAFITKPATARELEAALAVLGEFWFSVVTLP